MNKSNTPKELPKFQKTSFKSNRARMAVFDKLPKEIKRELMYGEVNWCAISVFNNRKKKKTDIKSFVEKIRQQNHQYWRFYYSKYED